MTHIWPFYLQADLRGWITIAVEMLFIIVISRHIYIRERQITNNKAVMRIKVYFAVSLFSLLWGPLVIIISRYDAFPWLIIGSISTALGIILTPILLIKIREKTHE